MGAKLSVLPGTGETDPEGFERVALGTTPASLVIIGSQLVARRHGGGSAPSAVRAVPPPFELRRGGGTVKNGVATCQSWHS